MNENYKKLEELLKIEDSSRFKKLNEITLAVEEKELHNAKILFKFNEEDSIVFCNMVEGYLYASENQSPEEHLIDNLKYLNVDIDSEVYYLDDATKWQIVEFLRNRKYYKGGKDEF